jgi:uncharacterized iron-regulated membrane protein
MKAEKPEGFRLAMAWLHTWTGLLFGWVLFAMFFTGTLAFFRPEINAWMRPEIQVGQVSATAAVETGVRYLQTHAAASSRWFIAPPTAREPTLNLTYQGAPAKAGGRNFQRVSLDPASGQPVRARDTRGGDFFYRFHFELNLAHPWGRWLASVAGMFMLVAIISGIVTHKKIFADFFTFRPGKNGQRAWMDGHAVLSVLGLPFHLMITFSGLVLLMSMLLPAGILAAYDSNRAFFDEAFPAFATRPPAKVAAPLADIGPMLALARAHWGGGGIGRITISNPGDAAATVAIGRSNTDRIAFGRTAPSITFDGASGRLLSASEAQSGTVATAGTVVGLHLGVYAQPLLRWFYFLISLAGTAMVGSGLALWVVKRRRKAGADAANRFSLRLVDGLNAGAVAGILAATAAYFLANRLLPAGLAGRGLWETRVFFAVWAFSLIYAYARRRTAWRDIFGVAAASFLALPLVNAIATPRHLAASLAAGDWTMAGFDLTVCASGMLLAGITLRLARKAPVRAPRGDARARAVEAMN